MNSLGLWTRCPVGSPQRCGEERRKDAEKRRQLCEYEGEGGEGVPCPWNGPTAGPGVGCGCEDDGRGAGFPRPAEAPKIGVFVLRVLISEGEGDGVGDAIRVDDRGPGFNPSAWIRVDGRGPAPASSLIKNTPHKDPNFGASGARGNPAPLSSTSHRQLTLPPTPPPPSIQHLLETNTCACRGSPRTWTPQSLTSSAPLGNGQTAQDVA